MNRGRESMANVAARQGGVRVARLAAMGLVCASAIVAAGIALAQTSAAPAATNSTPPAVAPSSLPSTILPTITEAPEGTTPPPRTHQSRHRRKASQKTPNWVTQSKVQLALETDPRLKDVHGAITQPGVVVLNGEVFDDAVKAAAAQTVGGVEGVKQVINALTTQSLKWLLVQNRINQALQQNGLTMVSVKVIGKTAFLSGQVSSAADKDRAVATVKSAAPEVDIGTNLIGIQSSMF